VYPDGSFDYIPIPEHCGSTESRTYRDIDTRDGPSASAFAGADPATPVHFDPEFATYTYGEVGTQKCASLTKLDPDDLLVFCAGLAPADGADRPRIYAIGYLTVDDVLDLEQLSPDQRADIIERYPNNAHVKREGLTPETLHPDDPERTRYPAIIAGDPDQSRLLDRAVPLSSTTASGTGQSWYQKYRPLGTAEHVLGLNATDLKRSNPKKIRAPSDRVRNWLEREVAAETTERHPSPRVYDDQSGDSSGTPELRSYVVSTDSGFAPHSRNGLLTLATCKPRVRSSSEPGDWVVGVGGEDHDSDRQLVYAFRVEHTLTMAEYFTDDRFASRKPLAPTDNPAGDNIYAPREIVEDIEEVRGRELPEGASGDANQPYELGTVSGEPCYTHPDGAYFQLAGGYHSLDHYKIDVEKRGNREKVLLSADYYYFGDSGPEIPEQLAARMVPGYGDHGQRRGMRLEPKRVDEFTPFVSWLRTSYRPGRHGEPVSTNTAPDPSTASGPCR
jgi:hypothetical protein